MLEQAHGLKGGVLWRGVHGIVGRVELVRRKRAEHVLNFAVARSRVIPLQCGNAMAQ